MRFLHGKAIRGQTAWHLLTCWLLIAVGACHLSVATAQIAYPTRPIRVIVPFSAGGGVDAAARVFAVRLSKDLGVGVVVDNRDGAGGIVGAMYVASAAPDGYTILFGGSATHGIVPAVHKHLPYDPLKDFAPVIAFARQPMVMVVNAQVPARTLSDFIALAKREPGTLTYASPGKGTLIDLIGAMFDVKANVSMRAVAYRGVGPGLVDLMANRVQVSWVPNEAVADFVRAGKLRALAVTSASKSAFSPELPTIASVVPGYEATGWYGVLAPAKTPAAAVSKLNSVIAAMLDDPTFRSQLAKLGLEPIGGRPEAFSAFIGAELTKWQGVAREAKLSID